MTEIRAFRDVADAVARRPEFVVVERDGYAVVDYVYQSDDTFDDPVLLECRGIKFAGTRPDSPVIARPLHKFFNLGEKPVPIDWTAPHVVTEKLDGSMIHPAMVGGQVRLMTRKGVTDVALRAEERFLRRPEYFQLMRNLLEDGQTPIFEYTAPDNRIVLRYDEPRLTLLAIRETVSGRYLSRRSLEWLAQDVPVVRDRSGPIIAGGDLVDAWVGTVRSSSGEEGVVVSFDDGVMLKIKTNEYVSLHRAANEINSRKGVLSAVLGGYSDDLIPLLSNDDRRDFLAFRAAVSQRVDQLLRTVLTIVDNHRHLSRKDFALTWAPHPLSPAMFTMLDGKDTGAAVMNIVRRKPHLLAGLEWRGDDGR